MSCHAGDGVPSKHQTDGSKLSADSRRHVPTQMATPQPRAPPLPRRTPEVNWDAAQAKIARIKASGRLLEVARISSLVTEAARDWQTRQADMSHDEIALRTAPGEGRFAPY